MHVTEGHHCTWVMTYLSRLEGVQKTGMDTRAVQANTGEVL